MDFSSEEIASFWNKNPCGADFVEFSNWKKFFQEPDNVYSRLFSKEGATQLLNRFKDHRFSVHYFNERHFSFVRSLLSQKWKQKIASMRGWHLWIRARK